MNLTKVEETMNLLESYSLGKLKYNSFKLLKKVESISFVDVDGHNIEIFKEELGDNINSIICLAMQLLENELNVLEIKVINL